MSNHRIIPQFPLGWREKIQQAADDYGTPLFVYFTDIMEMQLNTLRTALPSHAKLFYSVKANPNPWIMRFFAERDVGFELASQGELLIAQHAGIPAEQMILVGPAKTNDELNHAVSAGLQAVVVESATELTRLEKLASGNAPISVALRLNLGRSGGRLSMAGETQFGMEFETALTLLKNVVTKPSLQIIGLHTYPGTQRFSPEDVLDSCKALIEAAVILQKETSARLSFLDFGGGFGLPVRKGDEMPDWRVLRNLLTPIISDYVAQHPWTTTLAFEAGRFLAAPSGVLVMTVQDVKTNGERQYVLLDGGIAQFGFDDRYFGLRPPMMEVLTDSDSPIVKLTLCGPLCTPADRIAADILISQPRDGDRICIFNTGAYGLTANPGLFLSQGFAAEALVDKDGIRLIRRRFSAIEYAELTTLPDFIPYAR